MGWTPVGSRTAVCCLCRGILCEVAAGAFPRLVAFNIYAGAHSGFDLPGGRSVENGYLRDPENPFAAFPGRSPRVRPNSDVAGVDRHRLWCIAGHRPEKFEDRDRLFIAFARQLYFAGSVLAHTSWHEWGLAPDGQPRDRDRWTFPARGTARKKSR